jgi:hypothetical protein
MQSFAVYGGSLQLLTFFLTLCKSARRFHYFRYMVHIFPCRFYHSGPETPDAIYASKYKALHHRNPPTICEQHYIATFATRSCFSASERLLRSRVPRSVGCVSLSNFG